MGKLIGFIIGICGVIFGLYFGFWVMFVGGLVDIIDAVKAPVTSVSIIGFGVLKMMFASFVGGIIVWAAVALGGLIGLSSTPRRRRF